MNLYGIMQLEGQSKGPFDDLGQQSTSDCNHMGDSKQKKMSSAPPIKPQNPNW